MIDAEFEFIEGNKPEIDEMEDYFIKRVKGTPWEGITIKRDKKEGNYVITSLGKTEHTYAGEVPATLLISSEGRKVIYDNPGLLREILYGPENAEPLGEGLEGKVYAVELNVGFQQKEFALKYIFPVAEKSGDVRAHFFMPGIQTMRLMQQADKEKPVPSLNYAVPVLATIDMTLAPFIENSISLPDLYEHYIQITKYGRSLQSELHDQSGELIHKIVNQIAIYDRNQRNDSDRFITQVDICLETARDQLGTWMMLKKQQDPELQAAQIDPVNESGMPQSTVILPAKLHELFTRFKKDRSFNAQNPEFMNELMKICTVVEMTSGIVEVDTKNSKRQT